MLYAVLLIVYSVYNVHNVYSVYNVHNVFSVYDVHSTNFSLKTRLEHGFAIEYTYFQ